VTAWSPIDAPWFPKIETDIALPGSCSGPFTPTPSPPWSAGRGPCSLVGPGTELVAVTLFDLWQNGQVTELAAMGVLWLAFMSLVGAAFHVMTRRYRLSLDGR
jgi:hypothetical protein